MKHWITLAASWYVAVLLSASQARAQCPANTNPLQIFVGTWSFKTEGSPSGGYAAAGQFKASVGTKSGSPTGVLDITDTTIKSGTIVRQQKYQGTFEVNADCSGGSFTFNAGQNRVQADFWFVAGTTKLYFVSNDSSLPVSGEATKI